MGPSYPELRAGASHGQLPCRPIGRPYRRHQRQPCRRHPRKPAQPALRPRPRRPSRHRGNASGQPVRPDRPERPRDRGAQANALVRAGHVPLQVLRRGRFPASHRCHGRERHLHHVLHRRQRLHVHGGRHDGLGRRAQPGQAFHRHPEDGRQRPGAYGSLPRLCQRREGGVRDNARHAHGLRRLHAPRGVRAGDHGPRRGLACRKHLLDRRRRPARAARGRLPPQHLPGAGAREDGAAGQLLRGGVGRRALVRRHVPVGQRQGRRWPGPRHAGRGRRSVEVHDRGSRHRAALRGAGPVARGALEQLRHEPG